MVATDWTSLGLAALGVAGTLGGGFVGGWMQGRTQERAEQQRQRDQAAEVVGIAFQLVLEVSPSRLGFRRDDLELFWKDANALVVRHDAARVQLRMLAARHPDRDFSLMANNASTAMALSIVASIKYVSLRLEGTHDITQYQEAANQAFADALARIEDLLEAVHH